MQQQFKTGDVVRLRSGGPAMTVTKVGEQSLTHEPAVWCVWFVHNQKFEDTFSPGALMPATPQR
jgi:uncharacterized protein YodC (DUF2158 family)